MVTVKGYALVEDGKIVTNNCDGSFRVYHSERHAKLSIGNRDAGDCETVVEVEVRVKKARRSEKR